jgi:hypothetical protein
VGRLLFVLLRPFVGGEIKAGRGRTDGVQTALATAGATQYFFYLSSRLTVLSREGLGYIFFHVHFFHLLYFGVAEDDKKS